jgi:shikimate dehydrogenase
MKQPKTSARSTPLSTPDGRLTGYNSDSQGAVRALSEHTAIQDRRILVIGAGGAARAVAYGLIQQGGRVCIVNRSREKGEKLARFLGADFCPLDQAASMSAADILINTTPVGMHPHVDAMPIPDDMLHPGMVVMDIVYHPLQTRLLQVAAARGCRIVDGVAMFVYQGAMQFERWTGRPAPVEK